MANEATDSFATALGKVIRRSQPISSCHRRNGEWSGARNASKAPANLAISWWVLILMIVVTELLESSHSR